MGMKTVKNLETSINPRNITIYFIIYIFYRVIHVMRILYRIPDMGRIYNWEGFAIWPRKRYSQVVKFVGQRGLIAE